MTFLNPESKDSDMSEPNSPVDADNSAFSSPGSAFTLDPLLSRLPAPLDKLEAGSGEPKQLMGSTAPGWITCCTATPRSTRPVWPNSST